MNVVELLQLLNEVEQLLGELKADGTLAKLQDALTAVESEVQTNTKVKGLMEKAKAIAQHQQ